MNIQLGLGKNDRCLTVLHGRMLEGVGNDGHSCADNNQDEGRRAGFLALGMLLIAAAVISIRVPLMPTAVFIFGTALCLLQLSPRGLAFIENNRLTKIVLTAWQAIGGMPRGLRAGLLLVVGLVSVAVVALMPGFSILGELVINLLLMAGLVLFVGPKPQDCTALSKQKLTKSFVSS